MGRHTVQVAATLVALILLAAPADALKRTEVGEPVKDFAVASTDGGVLRLSERLGRKATLVLFWATWSPRSAEALKDFQALYEEHGPPDLEIIAVNVEHQDWQPGEERKVHEFVVSQGVGFPVVVDRDLSVFNEYGVIAVPSTVLVDGQGQIREILEGYAYMTRFDFRDRILETLGVAPDRPEEEAEAAVGYTPRGTAARHYQMGMLLVRKKRPKRALLEFQRALREDPDYADAHLRLAELYEAQGRTAAAAQARVRATELGGGSFEPVLGATTGGPDERSSGTQPEAADREARNAAMRYVRMGRLLLKKDMPANATRVFERAVESDPGYRDAYLGLAEALEAEGRGEDAANARARAAALDPERFKPGESEARPVEAGPEGQSTQPPAEKAD